MNKNLLYITESVVPNTNAEIIHVLKICDAFVSKGYNVTVFTLVSDKTTTDTENNLSNIYKNEVSYKYQIAPIKKYQADVLDSSSNKIGNSIEVFF